MTDLLAKLKAIPLVYQVGGIFVVAVGLAYAAGVRTPEILAMPYENKARSLANKAAIDAHIPLDAHNGAIRGDSLLREMVRELAIGIDAHFERLICIDGLEREFPAGLPATEQERRCPAPRFAIPGGDQ